MPQSITNMAGIEGSRVPDRFRLQVTRTRRKSPRPWHLTLFIR